MIEFIEVESLEILDYFIDMMKMIVNDVIIKFEFIKNVLYYIVVRCFDEVKVVRNLFVKFKDLFYI